MTSEPERNSYLSNPLPQPSSEASNPSPSLPLPSPTTATSRLTAEAHSLQQQMKVASSSSRNTTTTTKMQDITTNFRTASEKLAPGELVKDEFFTLFEAVGALEIMDPKMDSGFVEDGDAFEAEYDVGREEPSGAETLWIMDEMMRLEMLFLDGYPLSQNIFTSLHIFKLIDPSNKYPYPLASPMRKLSLTQRLLRVYGLAVIKSCQLLLDCIQAQTFYEEEDFVTHLFGRELCPNISAEEVVGMVSDMEMQLLDDTTNGKIDQETANALSLRLEMRRSFLCALEQSQDVEYSRSVWLQLRSQLDQLASTRGLVHPLPTSFSHKVQRQLASSTPPRPMPEISWEESQQKWIRLCEDVLAAYDLTRAENLQNPHQLKSGVWTFAYRNPPPTTYARAKLQELLTAEDKVGGAVSHFDLMLADIRELVLPLDPLAEQESFLIEATHDIRHRTSRVIEDFMIKAFGEYLNVYRMICQNRERTRRLITQAIPIFDELEVLALEADDQVMKILASPRYTTEAKKEVFYPLWVWTRLHKLRLVQWAVQLGFETGLYQDSGVHQMYDVLTTIFTQEDRAMRTVISSTMVQAKMNPKKRKASRLDVDDSIIWLYSLQQECHVHQDLAMILTMLWEFVDELGLVASASERPYYEEQRQYEARMKPLLRMQHQVAPTLDDLRTGRSLRATEQCSAAELQEHFEDIMGFSKEGPQEETVLARLKQLQSASSKDDIKRQQELKRLEATCWAIKIVLGQLVSVCKKLGKEQEACGRFTLLGIAKAEVPEAKQRKHPWWVVPKITDVA